MIGSRLESDIIQRYCKNFSIRHKRYTYTLYDISKNVTNVFIVASANIMFDIAAINSMVVTDQGCNLGEFETSY